MKIKSVNDFVIKFANVNGSGSASANQMFAKGVFRSGIPVSPKNIFPSNIQGLPTWFEVRVNEKGYLGRREGIDLFVAMKQFGGIGLSANQVGLPYRMFVMGGHPEIDLGRTR